MAERIVATAKTLETKHKCPNSCKQNLGFNSSGSSADRILQLQRTAGNQAVQRLIKSKALQAKLRVGQPNDIYEQEADRVAEQVMRMPDPILQRKCAKCDEDEKSVLQAKESLGQMPVTQGQDVPPMSPLPYDHSYKPSPDNCSIYQSSLAKTWFTFSYRHNAECACKNTLNEPHNNCVRKCLQVKMKAHLAALNKLGAALPLTLPGEADPMCHDMWQQHVECYGECGCSNKFINYLTFSTMCRMPFPCFFVSGSIERFNSCSGSPADRILKLQKIAGNQAIQRLTKSRSLQAKLRIGQDNDVYEQEADRVAEQVMRMQDFVLQRQNKPEEEEKIIQTTSSFYIYPLVRQKVSEEDQELVQTKETTGQAPEISPDLHTKIIALRVGGQPLPASTRAFFEPRFGFDFSQIRVHVSPSAAETARAVNAQAYTIGKDVIFAAGQYSPETPSGKRLLAHELTHVVQQGKTGISEKYDIYGINKANEPTIQRDFFGSLRSGVKKVPSISIPDYIHKPKLQNLSHGQQIPHQIIDLFGNRSTSNVLEGVKYIGEKTGEAATAIGKWGRNVLKSAGAWVWALITETPGRIWSLLKHVGSAIVGIVSWLWEGLTSSLGHICGGVKSVFSWLSKGVEGLFGWIWEGLQMGGTWAWKILNGDFSGFWEGIGNLFSWFGRGFKNLAKWGWEGLKAAAIWVSQGVKGFGKWIWEGHLRGAVWVGRLIAKLFDLRTYPEILDLLWQIIKFNTRTLTSIEEQEARSVFMNSINYWQVRIDEYSLIALIGAKISSSGMGVTTFHSINFNRKINTAAGNEDMIWLIHELTHVAQMEHVGSQYIGEAVYAQATEGYDYTPSAKSHLSDYNREQQASIVENYYKIRSRGGSTAAYDPYIAELRAGKL